MNISGFFITFEGGEACGKSTQIPMLAEKIRSLSSREVIATRSPGGTPAAEKIRSILKERIPDDDLTAETELLLFGACHAQMCEHLIRPVLQRGAILISDRFVDSTIVYQGIARGLGADKVRKINEFACRGIQPDLTILLDLPPETALKRIHSRSGDLAENDRFDSAPVKFHQAVRQGFLDLAAANPNRFAVIDASPDPQTVHNQILEVIHERLGII